MYGIGELLLNWRRYYSLYVSQNFLRAHAIFPSRHILRALILLYPLVYFHTILLFYSSDFMFMLPLPAAETI